MPKVEETVEKDKTLSANKLDSYGNLMAHKKEKVPSCEEKGVNDNAIEQLKSLIIAQSTLMTSLSDKTDLLTNKSDLALSGLDKTGVALD